MQIFLPLCLCNLKPFKNARVFPGDSAFDASGGRPADVSWVTNARPTKPVKSSRLGVCVGDGSQVPGMTKHQKCRVLRVKMYPAAKHGRHYEHHSGKPPVLSAKLKQRQQQMAYTALEKTAGPVLLGWETANCQRKKSCQDAGLYCLRREPCIRKNIG